MRSLTGNYSKKIYPMIDYRDRLAGGDFDLIIADIPWSYSTKTGTVRSSTLVSYTTIFDYVPMFSAFYAALKDDRNLWVWTDGYNLPKLLKTANDTGFTFRDLCVIKRRNLGLGYLIRKQVYFLPLFSKGKAYKNHRGWLSEYLGEYQITRSKKPQAVYDAIKQHSLPPNGRYIDPFPDSHTSTKKINGIEMSVPSLWSVNDEV